MGYKDLVTTHIQQWGKADPRQRRDMIQAEVRYLEEEGWSSWAVELEWREAWTKWDLPKLKTAWDELVNWIPSAALSCSDQRTTLSQPQQSKGGPTSYKPTSKLCGENGTLVHILLGKHMALWEGSQSNDTEKASDLCKTSPSSSSGKWRSHPPQRSPTWTSCRRHNHRRWGWTILGIKLHFPYVFQTSLRPDRVMVWGGKRGSSWLTWWSCGKMDAKRLRREMPPSTRTSSNNVGTTGGRPCYFHLRSNFWEGPGLASFSQSDHEHATKIILW